ncbi:MAG: phenylacetate--CoA ligase family protein [Chloroflexi bacterium]|nr:phenylacetate--CoA ligase family protein [Chloroflexota bacterium]
MRADLENLAPNGLLGCVALQEVSAVLQKKPIGYWNPRTELMPREKLEDLQVRRLRVMVAWAQERSPLWQRKLNAAGVKPDDIRTLEDIQAIPFLTKSEILDSQQEHPPFGDIFTGECADLGVAYHQTSGTSGRAPLRVFETARGWNWGADTWATGLYAFGVRRQDVVYFAFGYGPFQGFWGAHYAFQKIGATTIPGGAQTSENRIRQIIELGATVVAATPSYAIRLAQIAEGMGINLATDSKVEMLLLAGEPGANVPATKAMIERAWGAHGGDFAGMTESSGLTTFECSEKPGGMHINDANFIEEVVDPIANKWLEYGQRGERISTSFGKGVIPLLRYRTGDLVEKTPGSRCACGRTWDIYNGGIIGRVDDMKLIRGTNVFPSAIEGVVRKHDEIHEFQIVLHKVTYIDEITVRLDPKPDVSGAEWPRLMQELTKELAEAHEGLRFNVEMATPGELPTFEHKAKRLVDRR